MGRRMMRAVGAGLMEAGRQSELSRKEELELKRQQNLKDIADGRQGLMREQLGLMKTRNNQLEGRAVRTERGAAIDAVQARMDKLDLMSPDNQDKLEYFTKRDGIMALFEDEGMDAKEMQVQLADLREGFAKRKASNFAGTEAEVSAYKSRMDRHVKDVESFFRVANTRMKDVPGWKGRIEGFIQMGRETRARVDPSSEDQLA